MEKMDFIDYTAGVGSSAIDGELAPTTIENPVNENASTSEIKCDTSPPEAVASTSFKVDNAAIVAVPKDEQAEELRALGLSVYNQTSFEEGILQQVDKAFQEQENARQKQMAERALTSVVTDIRSVKARLNQIEKAQAMLRTAALTSRDAKNKLLSIQKEKENKDKQLKTLRAKQRKLMGHISGETNDANTDVDSNDEGLGEETKFEIEQVLGMHKPKESRQEHLIRTGQMTPFGTMIGANGAAKDQHRSVIKLSDSLTDFEKYLLDQGQLQEKKKQISPAKPKANAKKKSDANKHGSGSKKTPTKSTGDDDDSNEMISMPSTSRDFPPLVPKKKKKHRKKLQVGSLIEGKDDKKVRRPKWGEWADPDANAIDLEAFEHPASGSEYEPSDGQDSDEEHEAKIRAAIDKNKKRKKGASESEEDSDGPGAAKKSKKSVKRKLVDDGNLADYTKRINAWKKAEFLRKQVLLEASQIDDEEPPPDVEEDGHEEFDGGFRVPLQIWNKLYRYQQTCVRWLWELHCQRCGGIVGDEMGLGKTIQIIAYLAGLSSTELVSKNGLWRGLGPTLIITPTTVMHQWVKECHTWWPQFRVAILHESGSYSGTKESLVRNINRANGILITSYSGIVIHQENLLRYDWHYIILDEGHKIRNPDARATLVCKQFRTSHRLILSGSPMQNNLKELWSLFDFCFPGKLGTLPVFLQQFAVPITHGGYSNATQVQVQTAYKCAVVLRDTITPYLLRRMKADVKMNLNLPEKNEQVLFCRLTSEQRDCYKEYLDSRDVKSILDGRLKVFVGLIMLRKICNHPDLCTGGPKIFGKVDESTLSEDMHYGYWKRSGKMLVIESILRLWHKQGHRVLLFSQSKQMLDILERFIKIQGYSSLRMDGGTGIGSRQPMVARFNDDPSIFVFLLTTRVGGLGVNLTGANRVVIFDPDWNPSTDMQARERAWRIGQNRDVTIYRLVTSGTIEEKIYHRQIFKQFLTNRVLKDPRQRRFFKSNDMFELFVLKDDTSAETETSAIFAGTGSDIRVPDPAKKKKRVSSSGGGAAAEKSGDTEDNGNGTSCLSKEKILKMKELARKLSQQIADKANGVDVRKESSDVSKKADLLSAERPVSKAAKHKEKRQKQKKSEKLKKKNFEGIYVKHLVGKSKSDGKAADDDKKTAKQDEYVLQSLFAKTGVHAAMKHDTIMDSSNPDYMLVEGEAERVAKEAVKVLKLSRRMCARAEVGLPTWTGANGLSGAPSGAKSTVKLRFGQKKNTTLLNEADRVKPVAEVSGSGKILEALLQRSKKVFSGETDSSSSKVPSSSLLLAQMKQRNHLNPEVARSDDEDDDRIDDAGPSGFNSTAPQPPSIIIPKNRLTTEYDELLVDIRNFVAFQSNVNGEASTNEILDRFKHKVPPKDSAVFKALINKICDFTRNVQGDGIWQLKVEFR